MVTPPKQSVYAFLAPHNYNRVMRHFPPEDATLGIRLVAWVVDSL